MGDAGSPDEHPKQRTAEAEALSSRLRPVQIEGSRSYAMGHAVNYHAPCSAKYDQKCHLERRLTLWNILLYPARFELKELPFAPGRLSLVSFSDSRLDLPDPPESASYLASRALYWILAKHHCIVSLRTTDALSASSEKRLCDGLRHNMSLKTLNIQCSGVARFADIAAALQCLTSLEEVELSMHKKFPAGFVAALCTLLRTSFMLTAIRIHKTSFDAQESRLMLTALLENSTLKEFTVSGSLVEESGGEQLTKYLGSTTTLTTLHMAAISDHAQHSILRGILQNRTLKYVSLTDFTSTEESSRLVARIFRENKNLRSFNIGPAQESLRPPIRWDHDCIAALSDNYTLQELTLPMSIWLPADWAMFFMVLSGKSSLNNVYIQQDYTNFVLVSSVCKALAKSGAEDKVSFGTYFVIENIDLIKSKAFSDICLFKGATENLKLEALRQLPQCAHLTCLGMEVPRGNLAISLALANYVTSALHLQELQLNIGWDNNLLETLPNDWWMVIVKSLSVSASLKEVTICTNGMEKEDFELLAYSVTDSQNIRKFSLMEKTAANTSVFVRRLSIGIAHNYTLRSVNLRGQLDTEAMSSWFDVREATRRNSDILARVAQLVECRQLDRCGVAALERVSLHSALIEDAAEWCNTTKSSMSAYIRAHLRVSESLDAFMRLAGVVRYRVVCHPHDHGALQLDQLNKDCWNYVRQFLMLEDIKS